MPALNAKGHTDRFTTENTVNLGLASILKSSQQYTEKYFKS